MTIILDPGHGESTPGKRSPDEKLREYKYCREIVAEIKNLLETKGFKVETTVNTDEDIPLMKRCKIVNLFCIEYGKQNTFLVSIHCNAAGDGTNWLNARGWSVFIANNESKDSKKLAELLIKSAEDQNLKVRKYSPIQPYWKLNLAICRETKCPAVLTENLFMDNKEDVEFLLSDKGKKTIVDLHINGILDYINYIDKR